MFSDAAKNTMLDALTADRVRLHQGDPGSAGTQNAIGAGLVTAAFDAASGGSRQLSADVEFTGLGNGTAVTWFSVWKNAGTVFLGRGQITTGPQNASSAGNFQLKSSGTFLRIDDED